jgi:muconolactone delta-isomerase
MKIIAYDRFKPGVTMDTIRPLLAEEVAHAWRLWKRGIVRENYSRVDQPGVVLVFEADNAAAAEALLAEFPLTRAGFLEWTCIPVTVPFPLETVFTVDALSRVKMPDAELEWARGQKTPS